MSEGNVGHDFGRGVKQFIVLGQAAEPVQPSQAAFHDQALGQNFELMQLPAFDHLNGIAEHLFGPFDQGAGVTAVHEHLGDV